MRVSKLRPNRGFACMCSHNNSFQIGSVAFNTKDVGKVLQLLKPLVPISVFDSIHCRCLKPEIVRLLTNFMDGATVPFMMVYTKSLRQAEELNEELTENEERIEKSVL